MWLSGGRGLANHDIGGKAGTLQKDVIYSGSRLGVRAKRYTLCSRSLRTQF